MSNIARTFKHITPWFNIVLLHKPWSALRKELLYERNAGALKACSPIDFVRCICDVFLLVDGKKLIFKNTYFEKYLRTAASENLSGAAILTFRRHFRKNSLSAFCKIGAVKILRKAHMLESLFNKVTDEFLRTKFLRTPFLQDNLGDCHWYLENVTFKQIFSLDQYCWHATFGE